MLLQLLPPLAPQAQQLQLRHRHGLLRRLQPVPLAAGAVLPTFVIAIPTCRFCRCWPNSSCSSGSGWGCQHLEQWLLLVLSMLLMLGLLPVPQGFWAVLHRCCTSLRLSQP